GHLHAHGGKPADGLQHDGDGQALGQGPEHRRRGRGVPELRQEVLGERVVHHGEGHGRPVWYPVRRPAGASEVARVDDDPGSRPGLPVGPRCTRVRSFGEGAISTSGARRYLVSAGWKQQRGGRARMRKILRVTALLAAVSIVAAACGSSGASPRAKAVALLYDLGGRGDKSFNDAAAAGYDKAKTDFGFDGKELQPNSGGTNRDELITLA